MRRALTTIVCLAVVAVAGGAMGGLGSRHAAAAASPARVVPPAGIVASVAPAPALRQSAGTGRVPSGVRTVTVTVERPAGPMQAARAAAASTVVLSSPRKVRHAIRLLDALRVLHPGHFLCPMIMTRFGLLTVTYSAGPAGPALARAQLSLAGPGSPGSACDPIRLWVRQHLQRPLLGTSFAQQITQLAGLPLR